MNVDSITKKEIKETRSLRHLGVAVMKIGQATIRIAGAGGRQQRDEAIDLLNVAGQYVQEAIELIRSIDRPADDAEAMDAIAADVEG